MKYFVQLFCFLCAILHECYGFTNVYPKLKELPIAAEPDPGEALYLTPLIEAGKITEAQNKSLNNYHVFKNVKSYSGYLTVNKQYNSNLFFWYIPSETDPKNAPVVLWLQGGPGATSLFGLFTENGPFIITKELDVKLREYTWTKNHHVLYIDNPVGTGYSFTDDEKGYVRNEAQVGADLYSALVQFFQLFPELQKNDFFVTGESYGGKYVPAISYTIHKNNPDAKLKINLKGLALGNGFSDPIHQADYGDYLYQLGLIDTNTKAQFKKFEKQGIKLIQQKEWTKAFYLFDNLLDGDMNNASYFKNVTGFSFYYNFLESDNPLDKMDYMGDFIQRNDIRAAIHVGKNKFNIDASPVEINLIEDIMQSIAPWISVLLNYYPVLTYNGQLDIIVAYPLTVNFLKHLTFSASEEYKTAPRHLWYVEKELAGYVKNAGNLTEILVRNSGHMVPLDQPKWAFDLITRFTRNKPFY